MAAAPAKPPEEVPAAIKEDVAKLQKPLAAILVGKEIPWMTGRIGLRHGGRPSGSLDHPGCGQGQWSPGPGIPGWREWIQRTSAFTAMRLLQAVRVAANLVRGGNQGDHPATLVEERLERAIIRLAQRIQAS